MTNFSTDLLASPVNTREQRAVLKNLSTALQREIKAMYEEDPVLLQLSKERQHLIKNANDRAEIPSYFFTKIWSIEDERWRVFSTQHILVFNNHNPIKVKKNVGLDGKIAANDVCFQKSDFDFIPVDVIRFLVGRTTI